MQFYTNLNVCRSGLLWKLWENRRRFGLDLRKRGATGSELQRLRRRGRPTADRDAAGRGRDGHGPTGHRGGLHQPSSRLLLRRPHGGDDGGEPAAQGGGGRAGRGCEGGHVAVGAHRVDPVRRVHDCLHPSAEYPGHADSHGLVALHLDLVARRQEGVEADDELRVTLENFSNGIEMQCKT